VRFIACASIGYWSSGCHNINAKEIPKLGVVVRREEVQVKNEKVRAIKE